MRRGDDTGEEDTDRDDTDEDATATATAGIGADRAHIAQGQCGTQVRGIHILQGKNPYEDGQPSA